MITEDHVAICRKRSKGRLDPPAAHAAFWAGSVLIDVPEDVTDQEVTQLAQMAFPATDQLAIASAAIPIADAIGRIKESRRLYKIRHAGVAQP
jgi:thiamine pyrophosphate-dependent acetolactate synthase large subunit-like protein